MATNASSVPNADAWVDRAIKAYMAGNGPEAERCAKEACALEPAHPDALNLLGAVASDRGDRTGAEHYLTRAMEADPLNASYPFNLAIIAEQAGNTEAVKCMLERVLALEPSHVEALQRMLKLAVAEDDYPMLERYSRLAGSLVPDSQDVQRMLSMALMKQGKFEEAAIVYAAMFAKEKRQDLVFFSSYMAALNHLGRFKETIRIGEEAERHVTLDDSAHFTFSKAYDLVGNNGKSRQHLEAALRINPQMQEALTARPLFMMKTTNLAEGRESYHARFIYQRQKEHLYPFPRWQGEKLAGKRVLVWAEQGIGDVVMFGGFIPGLVKEGAQVTFAVYHRMITMFRRSLPEEVRIEPLYEKEEECPLAQETFDYQIPLGDLMVYRLEDYPPITAPGFLKADKERAAHIRATYEKDLPGFRVGIAWHTANGINGWVRNIPLQQWKPLFDLPGVRVVSLQYGDHEQEIADFERETGHGLFIDPEIEQMFHPEDFVDQIAALDAVVSIQSSAVHLAGAQAKPVAMLLSQASDFRWGLQREDNHWYPGVTIIRQERYGDWEPALKRAVAYVKERMRG